MKMNEEGQVTIPETLRELMGIKLGDELEVSVTKEGILIKPMQSHREQVAQWFRDEHGDEMATLTTDQIMRLIQ